MIKNSNDMTYHDLHTQGKVSENKIFIVLTVLIVAILALNWMAYHSVEVTVTDQVIAEESQQPSIHQQEEKQRP